MVTRVAWSARARIPYGNRVSYSICTAHLTACFLQPRESLASSPWQQQHDTNADVAAVLGLSGSCRLQSQHGSRLWFPAPAPTTVEHASRHGGGSTGISFLDDILRSDQRSRLLPVPPTPRACHQQDPVSKQLNGRRCVGVTRPADDTPPARNFDESR